MFTIDSMICRARRALLAAGVFCAWIFPVQAQQATTTGTVGIEVLAPEHLARVDWGQGTTDTNASSPDVQIDMIATNTWVDRQSPADVDEGDMVMMVMY